MILKHMKNTVQLSLLLSIGLLLLSVPAFAKPGIPAVHSISIQQDNIVFNVTSFGCSQDADFELKVEDGQRITLYRTRPDLCKRAPMVIQIKTKDLLPMVYICRTTSPLG